MRRGLNENYGRELMELHTLGVDGGYTQKDVTEVARAFTGWTIDNARQGGAYVFESRIHDPGRKIVLGQEIKAGGGESDGEKVLDILAAHPSTARFIATKLARRFVSDTPPPALVERVAATFRETDGDLRKVTQTLLTSPEFVAPEAYRANVKTPFEFVVSTIRVTGADVGNSGQVLERLKDMYQGVYECEDPTGYSDRAVDWMDPGVLAVRWQFAHDLLHGRIPGVSVQGSALFDHARQNPEVWEDLLDQSLLAGEPVGSYTLAPFRQRIQEIRKNARKMKPEERVKYVKDMTAQREALQKECMEIDKKRQAFINEELKRNPNPGARAFNMAMRETLRIQAEAKGIKLPE